MRTLLIVAVIAVAVGCSTSTEPVRTLTRAECMQSDECRAFLEDIGGTMDPAWVTYTENGKGTMRLYIPVEAFGRGFDPGAYAAEDCDPNKCRVKNPCRCRGIYDPVTLEVIGLDCECDGDDPLSHDWLYGTVRGR